MRVLNDQEEKQGASEPVSFFALLFYGLICALGFSSIFMSPFSLILAHRRLPDFWPKVAAIGGALLALLFLEVPPHILVFIFIFSVFVADGIQKQVSLWKLLTLSGCLVFTLGLLGLAIVSGSIEPSELISTWSSFVDKVIQQAQENGLFKSEVDWTQLRQVLFYQGPFYFVSGALLSVWFGIGLAAHFRWQDDSDAYSAESLRKLQLPVWTSFIVLGLWGLSLLKVGGFSYLGAGLSQFGFLALSIQGTLLLSLFLKQKQWRAGIRALIYSLFIFIGFYALVGLGLMSPMILIRKKRLEKNTPEVLKESV